MPYKVVVILGLEAAAACIKVGVISSRARNSGKQKTPAPFGTRVLLCSVLLDEQIDEQGDREQEADTRGVGSHSRVVAALALCALVGSDERGVWEQTVHHLDHSSFRRC